MIRKYAKIGALAALLSGLASHAMAQATAPDLTDISGAITTIEGLWAIVGSLAVAVVSVMVGLRWVKKAGPKA